jgi:hypothetical protein
MNEILISALIFLVVFGSLFGCYLAFDAVRGKLRK